LSIVFLSGPVTADLTSTVVHGSKPEQSLTLLYLEFTVYLSGALISWVDNEKL